MSYNIGDGTPVSTWNPFVSKCMRFVCMCVGLSVYMQRPEVPSALLLLGRVSYWTRSWADHWAPTIFLSLFSSGRLYMSKITGNLFHRRWGLYAHLRFSQSCFWLLSHHSSTTTYLIGVLLLFLRQCLTMFHCLLWWPGWSGILLFLIFYKQPEGKLAQHSECTCALAICPATWGHLYHDVRSGRGS